MNRTIALAYAITGLAVAAALVAIIGSTTGLLGSAQAPQTTESQTLTDPLNPTTANTPNIPATSAEVMVAGLPADPGNSEPVLDPSGAEIVYVDAPASPRRHDDDDDDDHGERHKEGKRGHSDREDDDD